MESIQGKPEAIGIQKKVHKGDKFDDHEKTFHSQNISPRIEGNVPHSTLNERILEQKQGKIKVTGPLNIREEENELMIGPNAVTQYDLSQRVKINDINKN
eukprot:CAMPEP_0170566356 /NCGR_PEP_ID=MMETSP0211-20121228/79786_1 /TAXON_ID=311385 /ORGANISM="Pseudokeronopsis sp., Strain OXSARD2" /LENGTH=99 /DNA_ID=CAMNT_0010887503 /DNA_START=185 /DNA_END=484 /DNA_ORIENTATION=+